MASKLSLEHLSFHSLFDALADAMLLVDEAGYVLRANPAAHTLLGYNKDEILGLPIETLIPEIRPDFLLHHHGSQSTHGEKSFVSKKNHLTVLTQYGKELHVRVNLISPNVEDQPSVIVMIYDDKYRQDLEEKLLNEERLCLAKRAAGFGIYDRDLTNNTLRWDDRSRELWGLSPDEEITYEKFEACIHPEDLAPRNAALHLALNATNGGEYRTEFRINRKSDGAERWIDSTGKIYFEAGQPVRLLGLMRDITELKTIERRNHERRHKTESFIKRQIAVETASAIAHEINQPLTAISAYSEVALHGLKNNNISSESLCAALEGCVTQAQRAGDTLHDLLNFLKQGELVIELADINELVVSSIDIAKKDGYGSFNPILQLDQSLPPVLCNPLQVQKVILNLVRNGIEASHEAGMPVTSITINVGKMKQKNMVQVTVQDNGPGFDSKIAEHIFEPFFTTKSKGIGMGLAISRSLIEANGGQLWHDPATSAGATIHFTLPFAARDLAT